jgi:hypothetical protein
MFASANCDGTSTPQQQVDQSAQQFDAAVAAKQIDCSNGFQDACQAIQIAQNCLGAAQQLAAANFPVPVDLQSTATAAGQEFVNKGSAYLRTSSSVAISSIGYVTGFLGGALSIANTILSLASAYGRCIP